MSFFEHRDYRTALRELVSQRKLLDSKFGFHALADAARIQRPYMSKVISGKADLSPDQLFLICELLKLDDDQKDFLELLLCLARSSLELRRNVIRKRLERISSLKRTTDLKLKSKVVLNDGLGDLSQYYLSPWMQLIHVAMSIPHYAKEPKLLGQVLGISQDETEKTLRQLHQLKLITTEKGEIRPLENYLHLSKKSPLFQAWRAQMRLAGMQKQSTLSDDATSSFNAIFSATEETRRAIYDKFLTFVKEFETEVTAADSRRLYQMSFDLMRWA